MPSFFQQVKPFIEALVSSGLRNQWQPLVAGERDEIYAGLVGVRTAMAGKDTKVVKML
ncbi:MAG: hypothetical protein JWP69_58 [Flaviaesturariibacter sp.]|nr:hypothetical protein [Flaviaesturariibacter sp.]